ncbi:MAG: DUF2231 domain-containing protein [Thermodesulfobacteriota bacterium]
MELIGALLPGVAEMQNLHPLVVHFPIALLNGFLLMEVLGALFMSEDCRTAARWMLYLGTLGAVAAVAFGLKAEGTLLHNRAIHVILERHEKFGLTVLILATTLSVWRILRERHFKTTERGIHIVVAAVMVAVMAIGADMGGLMVYKHGAGVKAVPMDDGHDHALGEGDHHDDRGPTDHHDEGGHDEGSHDH